MIINLSVVIIRMLSKKQLQLLKRARARRAAAYALARRRRVIPNYGMKPRKSSIRRTAFGIRRGGGYRVRFA
jgi:hypothetical protein